MNYLRYYRHNHPSATPSVAPTRHLSEYARRADERLAMKRKGWCPAHGLTGWYVPSRKVTP